MKNFTLQHKRVWVAGHRGMVGAALVRRLAQEDCDILTVDRQTVDLRRQTETEDWMAQHKSDVVVIAAAKVGGIMANATYPADFLYDNLMIEANIIHAAYRIGIEKLLFLGSSCIYPKFAAQPIVEESLLTGALEPTNEAYAIAKIAGIKLCQTYRQQHGCDFISAMPCNLYGQSDSFDAKNSHVIPALLMKFHAAKTSGAETVTLWGTGSPLREFLHVDDLAEALVYILKHYSDAPHINVGAGTELSIADLAHAVAKTVGYSGNILFDPSKPDGTPRKLMDNGKIAALGWSPRISLQDGLKDAYVWYCDHVAAIKSAA